MNVNVDSIEDDMYVEAPHPLESIETELEHINLFYNDLKVLNDEFTLLNINNDELMKKLKNLCDQTTVLRAEFSILYSWMEIQKEESINKIHK